MNFELSGDLENRLRELARRESLTVSALVERVLRYYVTSQADAPANWVQIGQEQLQRVWPLEDFSDWCPPNAP